MVSTTGVTQENLELPLLINSLNSHQTQNNKTKFWTEPTFLLPYMGNCPYKQDGEMLPMRSRILAEALNKTIFSSNTVVTFVVFNDSILLHDSYFYTK